MKITQDDLLDALRDALTTPADGDGVTVTDLVAATGYSEERVRTALRALARGGRLAVCRVRRPSLDGRIMPVPAYRITGKPKK